MVLHSCWYSFVVQLFAEKRIIPCGFGLFQLVLPVRFWLLIILFSYPSVYANHDRHDKTTLWVINFVHFTYMQFIVQLFIELPYYKCIFGWFYLCVCWMWLYLLCLVFMHKFYFLIAVWGFTMPCLATYWLCPYTRETFWWYHAWNPFFLLLWVMSAQQGRSVCLIHISPGLIYPVQLSYSCSYFILTIMHLSLPDLWGMYCTS